MLKYTDRIEVIVVREMERPEEAGAPRSMWERGRKTDAEVLAEVKKNPGLAVSEIATRLGWTNGRVDGSVNRLVSQKEVKVQHFIRRGGLIKKVYPSDYEATPSRVFEIPRELVRDELWRRKVYVYAVSRSTIGLSPIHMKEWESRSPLKDETEVKITEDMLQIELPGSLAEFYQLENSETSLSVVGDSAIITVEATIIPVDVPSEYPDLSIPQGQYVRLEETVIEKTTVTSKTLLLTLDKGGAEGKVEFDKDSNITVLGTPMVVEKIDTSGATLIKKTVEV